MSWSLGPECQNSCYVSIPGPGLCGLQELCCWLQPSTIKWDGQAYRRCPAASLTVPALYSALFWRKSQAATHSGKCWATKVQPLWSLWIRTALLQRISCSCPTNETLEGCILSSINPTQPLVCMSLAISTPWCVFCMLNLCVWGQRKRVWESTSVHAISDKCQAVRLSTPTLKTINMHVKPVCAVNNLKRDHLVQLAMG